MTGSSVKKLRGEAAVDNNEADQAYLQKLKKASETPVPLLNAHGTPTMPLAQQDKLESLLFNTTQASRTNTSTDALGMSGNVLLADSEDQPVFAINKSFTKIDISSKNAGIPHLGTSGETSSTMNAQGKRERLDTADAEDSKLPYYWNNDFKVVDEA